MDGRLVLQVPSMSTLTDMYYNATLYVSCTREVEVSMAQVLLGNVRRGAIVEIDGKTYQVTNLEAGIARTQLSPVIRYGSRWFDAEALTLSDRTDNGIRTNDTPVTVIE